MNKSILISIRPEHVVKILNGEKTLELRKSVPQDFVGWVYIYITKANITLYKGYKKGKFTTYFNSKAAIAVPYLNGKVVARFWFDDFDIIEVDSEQHNAILKPTCLTLDEVLSYCRGQTLYAWHIKNLEIFDEPKELSDFHYYKTKTVYSGRDCPPYVDEVKTTLRKAPKGWRYVWVD